MQPEEWSDTKTSSNKVHRLIEDFLGIKPNQTVANDIFWSLITPVLLELLKMTPKA